MTNFSVRHHTEYRYRKPVLPGEHRLLFRPRDSHGQRLIEAYITITPEPDAVHWSNDVFGNCVAHIGFATPASELVFDTTIRVDHTPDAAPDVSIDREALRIPLL